MVEVHASSVNPFDTMVREGYLKDIIPLELPVTLGGDIAGIVSEVGPGVEGFKVGDKVYGQANVVGGNSGAFAEYALTSMTQVGRMPSTLNYAEAASVVLTGLSAYQAIYEHIGLKAGQKILIHGGSGGIGSIAIQLAKYIGAHVIVTASGDGIEFVKSIGADEVIDYKNQKFEDLVSGVDAVFDTVGGETYDKSYLVTKENGVIVSMVAQPDTDLAEKHSINAIYESTHTSTDQLDELAKLIDQGVLKTHIDKTFKLDDIQAAFIARESGSIKGKVVVSIKD